MKKVFKKSILIVTSFIIGSIACISIGVYAYSYAATDIQYSGTTNVKQAIDDLYTKFNALNTGLNIFISSNNNGGPNGTDNCFSASEGCACYYVYNYATGGYTMSGSGASTPSTVGYKFRYGNHTNCQFESYGCRHNGSTNATWTDGKFSKSNCDILMQHSNGWTYLGMQGNLYLRCHGVITCET